MSNERQEVELLLSAARRCEARGPDIKAKGLLEKIQELQREENDPDLKVLIFTEFVPTQEMLAEFLDARGYPTVCLNGSLGMDERQDVQRAFREKAQILISTDAGGEGLNLQFCHVVVNFDLPWNPMKLEQRIGRVDRIGQDKVVRAINFALDGTVELRVREVLEEKLATILAEFGVDKLSDVLDSEEGGVPFEELFKAAVLSPEDAEARAVRLAEEIRRRAEEARSGSRQLGAVESLSTDLARQVANHQLPYWTERKHWKVFWEERGWRRDRVGYIKHRDGEHESVLVDRVRDAADSGRVECLAIVVNSIDRLVHGVGPEGNVLAAAVRQWAENGHMVSLLHCLVERGFDVAVCSDHGNVEAVGVGRPDLGSVPEDQGQRAIVFGDAATLEATQARIPATRVWPGPGLPRSMRVLLPQGRGAFSTVGGRTRTHGAASIEEVLVPFIRVTKNK